jgi:hypothetical protein
MNRVVNSTLRNVPGDRITVALKMGDALSRRKTPAIGL